MKLFVSHSVDPSTPEAIAELAADIDTKCAGQHPVAAIVLAAIDHDHDALAAGLRERLGDIPIIGCTTDGELSDVLGFAEDSIVVAVYCGDDIRAQSFVARNLSAGVDASVAAAFETLGDPGSPVACILLAESLTADAARLVAAVSSRLPANTVMFGGVAGDQRRMARTVQFVGASVLSDAAVGLLFEGNMRVGLGVCSGWAPMRQRGIVTSARDNVVYEIDGAPATDFYRRYFGETVHLSPDHPLAVCEGDQHYLRAPLGDGDRPGAIFFAGSIPDGTTVQITAASRDEVVAACETSSSDALRRCRGDDASASTQVAGAMIISCAARRQLLGTRVAEETQIVGRVLGGAPAFGFYSYGEIASVDRAGGIDFHNETFVTAVFGSR